MSTRYSGYCGRTMPLVELKGPGPATAARGDETVTKQHGRYGRNADAEHQKRHGQSNRAGEIVKGRERGEDLGCIHADLQQAGHAKFRDGKHEDHERRRQYAWSGKGQRDTP